MWNLRHFKKDFGSKLRSQTPYVWLKTFFVKVETYLGRSVPTFSRICPKFVISRDTRLRTWIPYLPLLVIVIPKFCQSRILEKYFESLFIFFFRVQLWNYLCFTFENRNYILYNIFFCPNVWSGSNPSNYYHDAKARSLRKSTNVWIGLWLNQ